jgi:transketolase
LRGTLFCVSAVSASVDSLSINALRGLCVDAVQKANSGHPGLPLGAMPMAYAIWKRHLRHNPANPQWPNRDRFVLSAGHGSMLLYSLLFATGYDLSLEELKNFRQWGSKTPGHPENHLTPGVEMATGPLGQGVATSVGMAMAERFLATRYNRPGFNLFDYYTYVICSDGDLMEGVAQEASSLAGHQGLGKLIWIYDDNKITIDGPTSLAYSEDVPKKFEALGWHVQSVDGMNVDAVDKALQNAKQVTDKPSIICAHTIIGYGSPNKANTSGVHGSPLGVDEIGLTKNNLGLPPEDFHWPDEAAADMDARATGSGLQSKWDELLSRYEAEYPVEAAEIRTLMGGSLAVSDLKIEVPQETMATRKANQASIAAVGIVCPTLLSGSADLTENVFTSMKGETGMQADNPGGRNIYYGIREHAMAAAANGISLTRLTRGACGTFLIFSDYCKPAIRLAALMEVPTIFQFSHDSIGLGEDGPTHQPIEQLAGLRAIPNCHVMRPADANEVAVCWELAVASTDTPSVIVTSRQNLPIVSTPDIANHPAKRGGYVLRESEDAQVCIVATGSEVSIALDAAKLLESQGISARVVSLPCWSLFEEQDPFYQAEVLDGEVPTLSVEAASTFGWSKYADDHIGLDHFGASAPAPVLFEKFGLTPANIVERAKALLGS